MKRPNAMKRRKPKATQVARLLRKRSTETERRLWSALRARQMDFKFRRQVPVCGYVVDFACFERKVVVELDGSQHASEDGRADDAARDARLAEAGFRVLRFWNHQVYDELTVVLEQIYGLCAATDSPSPWPSPVEGEGTASGRM